jgi:putative lysine transport system substrate-binding protein
MKKYVKVLSLVMAMIMIATLFGACGSTPASNATNAPKASQAPGSAKTEAPTAAPQKELKVGMECAYAPFNWTQSDDKNGAVPIKDGGYAGGYDVEIAKKIAEGLGMKLVVVKLEWDGLEPAVQAGTIDAIIAGMSPTAERKLRIDFTDPYYTSDLVVVVKKDGAYANAKTLKDFKGAKITAQLNTFHYTVIDQLEGAKKQTAMPDFPTMITALSSGVIDGYISERPGAISAQAANPLPRATAPRHALHLCRSQVARGNHQHRPGRGLAGQQAAQHRHPHSRARHRPRRRPRPGSRARRAVVQDA